MTAGGEQVKAAGTTQPAPAAPVTGDAAAGAVPGRRPVWVWAVPFALLFALLCVRNRFLFTTRLYEQGDAGANSILIEQAKHFTLLVGNYSRERFNHPGPAYMYVQAFGEYLFQNALHVVPTAWNAHMLSVFALDCAFVALAVGVVYGWTRSLRGAAACFAVFTAFTVAYPPILNSDWMPYMYVLAYMVFLLAAASVAAGRAQDAWIFALTGWFLIHGHACFLLFVPLLTVAVLAAVLWPRRHALRASVRPVLPRAAPGLDPGRGHQRGVRAAHRGQPGAALAGGLRQVHLLRRIGPGRRPQPAAGSGVRAVVLVAKPARLARAAARLPGRARRGFLARRLLARARAAAQVPGRAARRQRGLLAGVPALRRGRSRQAERVLHRLLLLVGAPGHGAGHRAGRARGGPAAPRRP